MDAQPNAPKPGISRQSTTTWPSERPIPKVVTDFIKNDYVRTHYIHMADCAKNLIEGQLKSPIEQGQCMVTCRAKADRSLEEKLIMRNEDRLQNGEKEYQDANDIRDDIADLAGVRVVLYLPSEELQEKVKNAIRSIWGDDVKLKLHDGSESMGRGTPDRENHENLTMGQTISKRKVQYRPRHIGYHAKHYRVTMKEKHTRDSYKWKHYDKVEIQVVSALTHVWAQVGHDILYKSIAYGPPTIQEERIMDSLNGLMSSGDLLLEQFYEYFMKRTLNKITDRDEFGIFLRDLDVLQGPNGKDQFRGESLDLLLAFLVKMERNYPLAVRNAIKALGYPNEPRLNQVLLDFEPKFEPDPGMETTVCLIRNMLLESTENKEQKSPRDKNECEVMMSALLILQRFAGGPKEARRFLQENVKMNDQEMESLDFVLAHEGRQLIFKYQDPYLDEPNLQAAWNWFKNQALDTQSVCGLCFQLAEIGVTEAIDWRVLLTQLRIGSLSRSSTGSLEEDGQDN